jgi:hypothetical protein
MRQILRILTIVAMVSPVARADDKDKKEEKKPTGPVQAKLVAKKATYPLDLDGKSGEDFKKEIKAGEKTGKLPKPPVVDLVLELTNASDKEVQLWISGDPVQLTLNLKGPGAVSVMGQRAFTREFRVPKAIALTPGKTHELPITSLTYGFRGVSQQAYWTEPGEYVLEASLKTGLSPAPEGTKAGPDGFGQVTIAAEPVKIKVEGK